MDPEKRKRIEAAGWKEGTVAEFLGLSRDEEALMEMRLALRNLLKECRREGDLTQNGLAERLKTSQPRVSKIEAADPTVSTDLLLRALVLAGATPQRIGEAIAGITLTVPEEKPQEEKPEEDLAATEYVWLWVQ